MSKVLLAIIMLSLAIASCSISSRYEERYILHVTPAFQDALDIELRLNANQILIKRYSATYILDSVGVDGKYIELMDSSRYQRIRSFIKPAFILSTEIAPDEMRELAESLAAIEQEVIEHPLVNRAGIDHRTFFDLIHIQGTDSASHYLGRPKVRSIKGRKLAAWLDRVEEVFSEQTLAVEAIEHSSASFRKQAFKVLSTSPLYIQLLALPLPSQSMHTDSLIKVLPDAEEVYLDMTHYQGRDAEYVASAFRKRYKHIRWIYKEPYCRQQDKIFNGR